MISHLMKKCSFFTGSFLVDALASYVVDATSSEVATTVQGGLYTVGAGGYGVFSPTWVAT